VKAGVVFWVDGNDTKGDLISKAVTAKSRPGNRLFFGSAALGGTPR
jgi:hypothetical protein